MMMVQVITRKKRRVFRDWEWKLIWVSVFVSGAIVGSLITYYFNKPTVASARCCYVTDKILKPEGIEYVSECGLHFYSGIHLEVGDTLKNFKSPKHE